MKTDEELMALAKELDTWLAEKNLSCIEALILLEINRGITLQLINDQIRQASLRDSLREP